MRRLRFLIKIEMEKIIKTRNIKATLLMVAMCLFVVSLSAGFFSQLTTMVFAVFLISTALFLITLFLSCYFAMKEQRLVEEFVKE